MSGYACIVLVMLFEYVTPVYPVVKVKDIRLDGDLSDWSASEASWFTLSGRDELAENQTAFRIGYDDEGLYISARCFEKYIKRLKALCRTNDGRVWKDDCIEIFIDTRHNHRTYYQFIVNSVGTRYDGMSKDRLWSGEWSLGVRVGRTSWTVEVFIPWKTLSVKKPQAYEVWGFNLCRERYAGGSMELHNWADVEGNFHRPTLFGHLVFFEVEKAESLPRAVLSKLTTPTRLVLPQGFLDYNKGKATLIPYEELIKTALKPPLKKFSEIEDYYIEHPEVTVTEEFNEIGDRLKEIRKLSESSPGASQSAQTVVECSKLDKSLSELYWKIKLKLLLEKL